MLVLANRRSILGAGANVPVFQVVATVCVGAVTTLALAVFVRRVPGGG